MSYTTSSAHSHKSIMMPLPLKPASFDLIVVCLMPKKIFLHPSIIMLNDLHTQSFHLPASLPSSSTAHFCGSRTPYMVVFVAHSALSARLSLSVLVHVAPGHVVILRRAAYWVLPVAASAWLRSLLLVDELSLKKRAKSGWRRERKMIWAPLLQILVSMSI